MLSSGELYETVHLIGKLTLYDESVFVTDGSRDIKGGASSSFSQAHQVMKKVYKMAIWWWVVCSNAGSRFRILKY